MKTNLTALVAALVFAVAVNTGRSANITWTNTSGANWSGTNNWSPNQVPGPADVAVITNGANYAVTLDVSPSIAGLVLGATSGASTQTLNTAGQNLTVNGVIQVNSQGAFSFNGGVYGVLNGTSVLVGTMTVSGGFLEGTMTVSSNSVLNIAALAGSYVEWEGLTLTNKGTVNWTNTVIYSGYNQQNYVYNYGLWNEQSDDYFYGGYQNGSTIFDNFGTLLKSGNTGTTTFDGSVILNNTGTVQVESGTLAVDGGGTGNGSFNVASNADIVFGAGYNGGDFSSNLGNVELTGGTLTVNGPINAQSVNVSGGTLALNGVLTSTSIQVSRTYTVVTGTNVLVGTMTVSGGFLEGTMTVSSNSVLNIAALAGSYVEWEGLTLTNNGTVNWTNTGIYSGYNQQNYVYNYGLWNEQSDDYFYGGYQNGSTVFDNFGTLRKSGNAGTTTFDGNVTLNNTGTVDVESGTLSLNSYNLTIGTLNFGISGATNFGMISLSGAALLTGTLSASLNGGYIPNSTNSFAVLTYGSETGVFTRTNLPSADAWQVNYGSTLVTLQVLNSRPLLSVAPNQTVHELTLLTVTNSATDNDTPAQTLTFGLVSAPSGMTLNANTGVISWTPAQAQSPSTNTILVSVTDNGIPPLSATNSFTVIVREVNVPPSLPTISTQITNELTLLTVTNTATNANIHSTIIGYTLVSPPSNMVISASGIITWTPAQTQSPGTNLITTIATNSNPFDLINPTLTSTNTFTVIVREVNQAPVLGTIGAQTATLLQLFTLNNSATEPNIHSVTAGFLLLSPSAGAGINGSGLISWTPAPSQTLTTATITTVVTNTNPYDLINPHLSATNTFQVMVVPNTSRTNISMVAINGTNLVLSWPADHTGWRLEGQTNPPPEGISANWAILAGSAVTNLISVPIAKTNGSVFFRMIYP